MLETGAEGGAPADGGGGDVLLENELPLYMVAIRTGRPVNSTTFCEE